MRQSKRQMRQIFKKISTPVPSSLSLALHSEKTNGASAATNYSVSDLFIFDTFPRAMKVQQRKSQMN